MADADIELFAKADIRHDAAAPPELLGKAVIRHDAAVPPELLGKADIRHDDALDLPCNMNIRPTWSQLLSKFSLSTAERIAQGVSVEAYIALGVVG